MGDAGDAGVVQREQNHATSQQQVGTGVWWREETEVARDEQRASRNDKEKAKKQAYSVRDGRLWQRQTGGGRMAGGRRWLGYAGTALGVPPGSTK